MEFWKKSGAHGSGQSKGPNNESSFNEKTFLWASLSKFHTLIEQEEDLNASLNKRNWGEECIIYIYIKIKIKLFFIYNFKNFYNFMKNIYVIGGTLTLFSSLEENIDTIVSLESTLTIE